MRKPPRLTLALRAANRANAQRSTGPRTAPPRLPFSAHPEVAAWLSSQRLALPAPGQVHPQKDHP